VADAGKGASDGDEVDAPGDAGGADAGPGACDPDGDCDGVSGAGLAGEAQAMTSNPTTNVAATCVNGARIGSPPGG
jgi:hypothetical protein